MPADDAINEALERERQKQGVDAKLRLVSHNYRAMVGGNWVVYILYFYENPPTVIGGQEYPSKGYRWAVHTRDGGGSGGSYP